jgi:hypothetical protein
MKVVNSTKIYCKNFCKSYIIVVPPVQQEYNNKNNKSIVFVQKLCTSSIQFKSSLDSL